MGGRAGGEVRHVRSSSLRDRAVTINGGHPRDTVAIKTASAIAVVQGVEEKDGRARPVEAAEHLKRRSGADPEQARVKGCASFVCMNDSTLRG